MFLVNGLLETARKLTAPEPCVIATAIFTFHPSRPHPLPARAPSFLPVERNRQSLCPGSYTPLGSPDQ
jgi:hypothetical protein